MVGVTKFGVFVQMTKLLVEGLCHVREMDGYWEYDERRYTLVVEEHRPADPGRRHRAASRSRRPSPRRAASTWPSSRCPAGPTSPKAKGGSKASERKDKRKTRGARRKKR